MEVMEGLVLNKEFGLEFLIQLVLFLSSFAVMKFLVFNPLMELIHIREHKTHGLKHEAEEAKQKTAKLKADYEELFQAAADEDREKASVRFVPRDMFYSRN